MPSTLVKCTFASAVVIASLAAAQSLPPPSRTVYKCEEGKKVYYSDSPCLGAKKIEVEPTRGLNRMSGRERIGNDVRRERHQEGLAEALRPITGQNAKELYRNGRRFRFSPEAQRTCQRLDQELPQAESEERRARSAEELGAAQRRLLLLRSAYRESRCE